MSRPKRDLLDRVVDGSFRPVRYARLLTEGELLPEEAPAPFDRSSTRRNVWRWLRHLQEWYRSADNKGDIDEALATVNDFAQLVRYLHGGRRPAWFDEVLEGRWEDGLEGHIALLDLVLDGTFVARRHAELLETAPLLPDDDEIRRLQRQRRQRRDGGR